LIFTASFFNKKAKLWIEGRKNIFEKIKGIDFSNSTNIWFHVSSLGEFEQGRPLIEEIKQKYPTLKIILTFFSPSGYEIRKNYQLADYIFYLPIDTKKNAKKFIKLINPKFVFWIKYDFWYNYLNQLSKQNVPIYLLSAIFRKNQIFFKKYGKWYKKILFFFDKIFVQNQSSFDILEENGIHNQIVAGDTRLDRVFEISQTAKSFEIVEIFKDDKLTIICGSTWEEDEKIISAFINNSDEYLKFIIAPHEIHNEHINKIINLLDKKYILYSQAKILNLKDIQVLIIDNIGMLSSLYKYADITYIGGGFGTGIHNTLEPAIWGLPIIFGPKYHKFQEAVDLINLNAAFSISNNLDFEKILNKLINENNYRNECGEISKNYILNNKGATKLIFLYFEKTCNLLYHETHMTKSKFLTPKE
jgi:3-deoxy-D-manno-octulosonic-acid transferase